MFAGMAQVALFALVGVFVAENSNARRGRCVSLVSTEQPGRWRAGSITYIYHHRCDRHVSVVEEEAGGLVTRSDGVGGSIPLAAPDSSVLCR